MLEDPLTFPAVYGKKGGAKREIRICSVFEAHRPHPPLLAQVWVGLGLELSWLSALSASPV